MRLLPNLKADLLVVNQADKVHICHNCKSKERILQAKCLNKAKASTRACKLSQEGFENRSLDDTSVNIYMTDE